MRALLPLLALALAACDREPLPLPTEAAVAETSGEAAPGGVDGAPADGAPAADRAAPPLYQLLYAADPGSGDAAGLQRVRALLWLQRMDLNADQLSLLAELQASVAERVRRLDATEAELRQRDAEARARAYDEIWRQLNAGARADAPELDAPIQALQALGEDGRLQQERLSIRMEGLRSILDEERNFLRTLSPAQEAALTEALFLLRHRLDPVGHPGDFQSLVGSIYDPGQFSVLTRGTSAAALEPLNIGALWSEEGALRDHPLHDARREVILLLALLEPGLDEAIAAARARATPGSGEPAPAPPG